MTISVSLRQSKPGFDLDISFEATNGVTALFGPSGSGKTTVVDLVAGLETPQSGRIVLGDETVLDTVRGINVPRHKRGVGYVFQDARLFPHLNVAGNIAFGARFTGDRRQPVALDDVVSLLGLEHLMERRPSSLSGGEAQRVGIARALMAAPRILLLDEPLAALDAPRRREILPYLEGIRDRFAIPMLYVSHAVSEVARLASTVVVLDHGHVLRVGSPGEVLSDPAAPLGEAGALIDARVVEHDLRDGLTTLASSSGSLFIPLIAAEIGDTVRLRVSASDILISRTPPTGLSALNSLAATVEAVQAVDATGANVQLRAGDDRLLALLTRRSVRELGLEPGVRCVALIKSMRVGAEDVGRSE